MKNFILILIFNFLFSNVFSQDISVYTEDQDKITTVFAKNIGTKITYSVSLTLNAQGYKITQAPPYEVILKPGEVKEVVKLIEKPGEKLSFEYQVNYKKIAGQDEPDLTHLKVLPKDTIYVFSGYPCSRSELAITKLNENNKVFKDLPLGDIDNYELLRNVLAAKIKPGQTFHFYTPIIVVDSVPITDPKKVDEFIKNLK